MSNNHFTIKDLIKKGLVSDSNGIWGKPSTSTPKVRQIEEKVAKKGHKYHAVKIEEAGVKYDSKRELKFKHLLDLHKIPYEMKRKFVLQEKFKYMGGSIREIAIIPDFLIINNYPTMPYIIAVIDVKGMILPGFKLKAKMLKNYFKNLNEEVPIFTPTNNNEMNETILELRRIIGI